VLARAASALFLALGFVFALAPVTLAPLLGCGRALEPANKPIDGCVRSCSAKASRQCSEAECRRGCEFILDRIVEKESENVLACIAHTSRRCTDVVWADCATRIGVHADGGPPAPPPPSEEE
jgi:hypothetical protein